LVVGTHHVKDFSKTDAKCLSSLNGFLLPFPRRLPKLFQRFVKHISILFIYLFLFFVLLL
jgi:hypothetical protein